MHISSLEKIHWGLLKLLYLNTYTFVYYEPITISKMDKNDLHIINARIKFGEKSLDVYSIAVRKRQFGSVMGR